jgi:TatD DNase family protein
MIETDAPWCSITSTHASFSHLDAADLVKAKKKEKHEMGEQVKGRNEPCNILQILKVIARIKGKSEAEVARIVYENTMKVFFGGAI